MNTWLIRISIVGSLLVVIVGGLFTMYVTEAGPFNNQVEPLACRNLSDSANLPEGKIDVLRRECEAARANTASSPRPIVTPVPRTPGPLVPCDQWDPSSGGACIVYGLIESRQPPAGFERVYRVNNKWAGPEVTMYAGSLYDDASRGVIVAMENDTLAKDGARLGEFPTPADEGALRIVSAEGNLLALTTSTGTEYTFDVDTLVLTAK